MSPAMAELAGAAFTGFDRTAMQFWHELAAEMTRDWFVANKQRYENLWVAPMTALLGEVARQIAPAYKPLTLGPPKVSHPSLMNNMSIYDEMAIILTPR